MQKGYIIAVVLVSVAIMGVIMYILIASILPLANKRFIMLYPKPESKAVSSPIK